MQQDNAIVIKGLKKQYRLGQIGGGTLTGDLQSWWARVRHKEDPNSKIGTDQRLLGQRFWALNGIDLTIKKGEALGIIGGNGAGKSTMLKILSRITAPTEGSIDIYGRIASMLEVGTGFSPEMTGRENIYMNGAILGMTKAEIDAKMEDIIEFSEVRDFIDTPVKRYSSGMYVKLAFSVAAHLDSEIMIMDEVLAVGDMAFQKKCLDKMRDAATVQGKTVLYVSHNMNTIRKLCDRCIVLNQGRIIFDGDVEKAIEIYLGSGGKLACNYKLDQRRVGYVLDEEMTFQHLVFKDKDLPIFKTDENLIISLQFNAKSEIQNMAIRMVIQTRYGESVGLVTTKPGIPVRIGKNEVELIFSHNCLAPGKYIVKLIGYSVNEYGKGPLHDVVENAFSFEIMNKTGETNQMVWNHSVWGHTQFPEMEFTCI